jgi:hypothetical protein
MSDSFIQEMIRQAGDAPAFPPDSRYHGVATARHTLADGRQVRFLRRRRLPPLENLIPTGGHRVVQDDRLDRLAALYLGDPRRFWQLCDANPLLHPLELTAVIGRTVRIAL